MRILVIFTLLSFTGVSSFTVKGYSEGNVIIYCHYDKEQRSNKKYYCKGENSLSCEDSIRTGIKNTWYHSGRFSLYDDTEVNYFMVVIRQLTRQDEGIYWCGVDIAVKADSYTKVELKVKKDECCKKSVPVMAYLGGEATIICNYPEEHEDSDKYLIKEDKGYTILSMDKSKLGRYTVLEKRGRSYTVTISNLTEDDIGTYWCGVETRRTDKQFALLTMQVILHVMLNTKRPTPSSSPSSSMSPSTHQESMIILACVSVVVLLIVIILIIVYRWRHNNTTGSVSSPQRGSAGPENKYEVCHSVCDHDIKKRPLQSNSGIAKSIISTTANLPRNPSDSLHYASINFHKNHGYHNKASTALSKEVTPSCEYATVKIGSSSSETPPIYYTVPKSRES
ncbi:hypothetical protein UPYG_G00059200 [Umbra pygmaea]|uniref:Immunoglobulin domain-containing protein n=1 Tax=Umbra pygmaea TaxID=75934 RepID=A0ABD0XYF7_UMBPY